MDALLKQMTEAVAACTATVEAQALDSLTVPPDFIKDILAKTSKLEIEGVSLLLLKTQLLAGYVNNVALVLLEHLARLEGEEPNQEPVERSVVQRVTLEKGVKPLEKKLSYQLDKMVRTFTREHQRVKDMENAREKTQDSDNSDSDSDSEDELNFKPDTTSEEKLAKSLDGKYRPPKLLAVAFAPQDEKEDESKTKKLQSMEEYLQEQLEAPSVEALIGLTIINHGRGGVKTAHDKKREKEIQTYEESNFTRLPDKQVKKNAKQKRRDQLNNFGGEDFGMFASGNRDISELTTRKRKATTAWDRAKKRRQ